MTSAKEAEEEFEKEKEQEIEDELGSKVPKPELKQGWGEWAGIGVNSKAFEARKAKSEQIRLQKIEELRKKRVD